MNVIECKGVTKSYRGTNALNGLSFAIEANKIVGLVGRNGAGKTTLLKILAGFFRETSGKARVFSKRPFNRLFVSANTIFIDEHLDFPSALTLDDVLKESGRFYKNWDAKLAQNLCHYFQFDERQIHKNLSRGKKSTFNMIMGIAARCPLTLFDEPATGMDAAVRKDMYRALLKDYLEHPRTILLSSHHLEEVEDLLEEVLLIDEGEKSLHLSMDDLNEVALAFTGKEEVVYPWLIDQDILYTKEIGRKDVYMVVKNQFSTEELKKIKQSGIHISAVSASDACVHLTAKTNGGIDDVFNRS